MKLFTRNLVACVLTGFVTIVSSDEFDMTLMQVGEVTQWRAHNGTVAVTYQGEKRGLYKYRYVRDNSQGEALKVSVWARKSGETVRVKDGPNRTDFLPHNCSFARGTCEYTETHSKRGKRRGKWIANVKNRVWSYKRLILDGSAWVLFEQGEFTVEPSGFVLNRDFTFYEDGDVLEKGWLRRIQ